MPWIYNKYTGHDDNRDWFMMTQVETRLVTHALYKEWLPEIFYDVHQQGAEGSRLFVPPFLDPVDPNIDPLIVRGIGLIGAEMSSALESRGKTGVVDHAVYDMWWHGGARSTPARHNMIGLLTEAASVKVATPIVQSGFGAHGARARAAQVRALGELPESLEGGALDAARHRGLRADRERGAGASRERGARAVRARLRDARAASRSQWGRVTRVKAWEIPFKQRDPSAANAMTSALLLGGIELADNRSARTSSRWRSRFAHTRRICWRSSTIRSDCFGRGVRPSSHTT